MEDGPKTPEPAKISESSTIKKQATPKLNEGTPSTLLTPVTPSQGSELKVLSPKKHYPTSPLSDPDDADIKNSENVAAKANTGNVEKTNSTTECLPSTTVESIPAVSESEFTCTI